MISQQDLTSSVNMAILLLNSRPEYVAQLLLPAPDPKIVILCARELRIAENFKPCEAKDSKLPVRCVAPANHADFFGVFCHILFNDSEQSSMPACDIQRNLPNKAEVLKTFSDSSGASAIQVTMHAGSVAWPASSMT